MRVPEIPTIWLCSMPKQLQYSWVFNHNMLVSINAIVYLAASYRLDYHGTLWFSCAAGNTTGLELRILSVWNFALVHMAFRIWLHQFPVASQKMLLGAFPPVVKICVSVCVHPAVASPPQPWTKQWLLKVGEWMNDLTGDYDHLK